MLTFEESANTPTTAAFRRLLPPPNWPKVSTLSSSNAQEWYRDKKDLPALKQFLGRLEAASLETPYVGLTTDGEVIPGIFNYASSEGAPTSAMFQTATALLELLWSEQKETTCFASVTDDAIRIWSNPEFYVNPGEYFSRAHTLI